MSLNAIEPIILGVFSIASSSPVASLIDCFVLPYTFFVLCILYSAYSENSQLRKRGALVAAAAPKQQASTSKTKSKTKTKFPSTTKTNQNNSPNSLAGTFKLYKNENYQKFLEVQGVGWALRKAADSANTVHIIKHEVSKTFHLKVISLIKSEIEYTINGEPVKTSIKDKQFMDTVTELGEGRVGVRIMKKNVNGERAKRARSLVTKKKSAKLRANLL